MRSRLVTLAIIVAYAVVLFSTNHLFTVLDDESTIISAAGQPVFSTLHSLFSGNPANEHPPLSDILLHFWLVGTNHSFFMLRVFANLFFLSGIFFIALAARRIAGKEAYWVTLVLGFSGPSHFSTAASPAGTASACF